MPGEKRSKAQKIKDRETISRLRLRGRTLSEIAAETGLSVMTVRRELKALVGEWQKSAAEDIAAVKARELRRLDAIEAETWSEWERSKKDYVKRVAEKGGKEGSKSKIETGGQCGDPRYLTVLVNLGERRAKILGMDAPQKVAPTDPSGEREYSSYSDAEIEARIAELTAKYGTPK
jgi:hypothetical protein